MNKSFIQKIVKALKISTWIFIAAVVFFLFVSFRVPSREEQQQYTYYAIVILIIGYACNATAKWITKNKLQE